jgi:hypothetical protein
VVVKNAWWRQVSNMVPWPGVALTSGIRRTTSRPVTWCFLALEVNAVNSTSATSAREIQVWVGPS